MRTKPRTSSTTARGGRRCHTSVETYEVSYLEWGKPSDPTMVLLHDIQGPALTMEWVGVNFADRFHVIAPDALSRGHSAWTDLPWEAATNTDLDGRLGQQISIVASLIESLDSGPATLIGSSMGGVVAAWMGISRPELTTASIIDDGGLLRSDIVPLASTLATLSATLETPPALASLDDAMQAAAAIGTTRNDPRSLDREWMIERTRELFIEEAGGGWRLRPIRPAGATPPTLPIEGVRLPEAEDIRTLAIPTLAFHNETASHWSKETVAELRLLNKTWLEVVTVPGLSEGPRSILQAAPTVWLLTVEQFLARVGF